MRTFVLVFATTAALFHYQPAVADQSGTHAPTRTPSFTRKGSESCLLCHAGEKMRAVMASPHFNLNNAESPATNNDCESCHGKGSIHVSRAHGGKGFPELTQFASGRRGAPREEQIHACLSCHADPRMGEKRIIFTGSVHDRPNINCSNCHSVHEIVDPMKNIEEQTKACGRCHRGDIRRHVAVDGKEVDFDTVSCATCHDVHAPEEASSDVKTETK